MSDPAHPTQDQKHGAYTVTIVKNKHGERAAKIEGPARGGAYGIRYVPAGLLSVAAGRDVWMRNILILCADCRKPVPAGETETDNCLCQVCYEAAGEANAEQDGR